MKHYALKGISDKNKCWTMIRSYNPDTKRRTWRRCGRPTRGNQGQFRVCAHHAIFEDIAQSLGADDREVHPLEVVRNDDGSVKTVCMKRGNQ